MKKIVGVYIIKNIINDKIYVGSSRDIAARWKRHKNLLNKNKHHSIALQRAWNKYKKENFNLFVIEIVQNIDDLFVIEQKYIDQFKSFKSGYNMLPRAGTKRDARHSLKTRKKLSKAFTGVKWSDEKKKIFGKLFSGEKSVKASTTNEIVKQIRDDYSTGNFTYKMLVNKYKVSEHIIPGIITNKTYYDESYHLDRSNFKNITNKISFEQAQEIRSKFKPGVTKTSLASEYNCSVATIFNIIKNKTSTKIEKKFVAPTAKFTFEKAEEIRKEFKNGSSCTILSQKYNVNISTIERIIKNVSYKQDFVKRKFKKFSLEDIQNIKNLFNSGKLIQAEIAQLYKVDVQTIFNIIHTDKI